MFGRNTTGRLKQNAVDASELALQLAQDRKFRKHLLAALEHGSAAGRRARLSLGLSGTIRQLTADQGLRAELQQARVDLQQAYARLEAKRRTQKLREIGLLAALASLAALPRLRHRFSTLGTTRRANSEHSGRPSSLDDLTKEQLYERAQDAHIPGRSEMSKDQLIAALQATS